jgi:hypothetical protein
MIEATVVCPRMNDARHATNRMMTSGLRKSRSSSKTAAPRFTGAGSLGPYCEKSAAASWEESPFGMAGGGPADKLEGAEVGLTFGVA